jgi:hypothetical protein
MTEPFSICCADEVDAPLVLQFIRLLARFEKLEGLVAVTMKIRP